MKSQINILRQIQEIVLTRDEHQRLGDGSRMEPLTDAIDALKGQLDAQASALYDRLYKRNHVVLAAMSNGGCSACGMGVPTAQAQLVRIGEHLVTCSACGRILYNIDSDEAHNVTEKPATEEIKSGVSRFSAEELVIPALQAREKAGAIFELAKAMEENHFIDRADALVSAALDRETMLSTAMEGGFAFPHVRGVEGGGLTLAMGVSRDGIDWDGEKVHVVFLTAIPVAVSAFYLNLMAGLAKTFSKKSNFDALLAAQDRKELWKTLLRATRGTVK